MLPERWRDAARRSPVALALLLAAGAPGCAGTAIAGATVAGPTEPPRPAGLSLDPVLELPRATTSAEPAAGLAVLTEPVDPEPARRVVRAFFEAVLVESTLDLERLVESSAHTRPNAKTRPEAALPWWRHRFDRLDYTALGAEVFYRRSDMETHTAREAATLAPGRPLPAVPQGDDIVIRVPIVGQVAGKLFGPEVVFLLRKAAPREREEAAAGTGRGFAGTGLGPYKIAELFEDFRLP